MVQREVKPLNEGTSRPPKGRMTWVGIAAIVLFVIVLGLVILRPMISRHDGPEPGVPKVVGPAVPEAGP